MKSIQKRFTPGQFLGALATLFLGIVTIAYAVTLPNTFVAGTAISAAQVNANFTALKNAVDAAEATLANMRVFGENAAVVNASANVNNTVMTINVPVAGNVTFSINFACLSFNGTTHTRWDMLPRVDGVNVASSALGVIVFPHPDIVGTPGGSTSVNSVVPLSAGVHTLEYSATRSTGDGSLDCDITGSANFFPAGISVTPLFAIQEAPSSTVGRGARISQ